MVLQQSTGVNVADPSPWLDQLHPLRSALITVDLVQSASDGGGLLTPAKRDIEGYLDEPVDDSTMRRIEEVLAARLFGARLEDLIPAR